MLLSRKNKLSQLFVQETPIPNAFESKQNLTQHRIEGSRLYA